MNRKEMLLTQLAEEAVEVAQMASKSLRFGLRETREGMTTNNAERLVEEMWDFQCLAQMLQEEGHIQMWRGAHRNREEYVAEKREKVEKYMAYSKSLGCLSGSETK